jgi:hypothetical protein
VRAEAVRLALGVALGEDDCEISPEALAVEQ